jgi:hypothetical protein
MFREPEVRAARKATRLSVLIFALGGAAGLVGGVWISEREAADRAQAAASAARQQLAAAVCADAFMTQHDARAALAKFLSVDWARRAEALIEEGWTTMPDRRAPDKAVARLCAVKLGEAYTTVRRSIPLAAPAP